MPYHTLHYTTFHYITLHYIHTLHACHTIPYHTLQYITLHSYIYIYISHQVRERTTLIEAINPKPSPCMSGKQLDEPTLCDFFVPSRRTVLPSPGVVVMLYVPAVISTAAIELPLAEPKCCWRLLDNSTQSKHLKVAFWLGSLPKTTSIILIYLSIYIYIYICVYIYPTSN